MYCAYGDESCGAEFVTYGTLLISERDLSATQRILASIKNDHGLPSSERLHSRVLFSGDQRRKSPWYALTMEEVYELYSKLFLRLRDVPMRRIVTVARRADFPTTLPGGPWQHIKPDLIGPVPWMKGHPFGEKHIAVFRRGVPTPIGAASI